MNDCTWRDDCGVWSTDCGHGFMFTDDGPDENDFKFCCFCGGALRPVYPVEVEDDEVESGHRRRRYTVNDQLKRSWQAANRWDAPRHPFPWRAAGSYRDPEDSAHDRWHVLDANDKVVANATTQALAEAIAGLPELMGEYRWTPAQGLPPADESNWQLRRQPRSWDEAVPRTPGLPDGDTDPGRATWGDVQSPPVKP